VSLPALPRLLAFADCASPWEMHAVVRAARACSALDAGACEAQRATSFFVFHWALLSGVPTHHKRP